MRKVYVHVEPLARDKMLAFAGAVKTEIGGLLRVRLQGQNLIVSDAWTVPQEVSVGSVDFEPGHFEDDLRAQGYITGRPMPWICMGIWHSHGNTSTFMSGTDEDHLVRKYAMRGYLVNIVVNRSGQWTVQVDTMVGPEGGKPEEYVLVTVPNELIWSQPQGLTDLVAKEIEANVKQRQAVVVRGYAGGQGYGHLGHFSGEDEWWEGWDAKAERPKGGKWWKRHKEQDRDTPPVPKDDSSIWTSGKGGILLEKDKVTGALLRKIEGKQTTFYGKDGRPIMVTKDNRTSIPREPGPKRS